MKLYKEIEINTEVERDRINQPKLYSAKEKKWLNKLLDEFEAQSWVNCKLLLTTECPNKDWLNYIGIEVYDVLKDILFWNHNIVNLEKEKKDSYDEGFSEGKEVGYDQGYDESF